MGLLIKTNTTSNNPAGRPTAYFKEEEEHIWGPQLFALASKRMNTSNIAGKFGCSLHTIADQPRLMHYVRQGWSAHDEAVLDLILAQANADPSLYEDFAERAQVRNLKADAVKQLYKVLTRDIPPTIQETERVRRLSDEELKQELAIALAKQAGAK